MNNDLEFDAITRAAERHDHAAAFVAGRIAHHMLGPYGVADPDMLSGFFGARPSVPKYLRTLAAKAAVPAIDMSSGLAPAVPSAAAFLAQVDRVSPLGQIGAITVDGHVTAAIQTGNATASWQGEQSTKPASALSFSAATLRPLKLIAQVVATKELADLSAPSALPIVQRSLVSVFAAAEGVALLDPTSAAIANVRPASITNGLTPITPAGDFANNVGQVLGALSDGEPSRPVLVVSFQTAVRMQAALQDLATIGVKVVISSAAGNRIIGVDADGLLVANGGVEIQRGQPLVQMDGAPDSPPTAATVLIATWQRDLVALKAERFRTWVARPGAVAYLVLA